MSKSTETKKARRAEIERKTAETQISIKLNLDGEGTCDIATGIGFLDHMLTLLAKHRRRWVTKPGFTAMVTVLFLWMKPWLRCAWIFPVVRF